MRTLLVILAPLFLGPTLLAAAPDNRFLLSSEGSGRATAYLESPKIITFQGRTHVAWLDSTAAGTFCTDFGYAPEERLAVVPTLYGNTVVAYRISAD